jgi:hypothetical protein
LEQVAIGSGDESVPVEGEKFGDVLDRHDESFLFWQSKVKRLRKNSGRFQERSATPCGLRNR